MVNIFRVRWWENKPDNYAFPDVYRLTHVSGHPQVVFGQVTTGQREVRVAQVYNEQQGSRNLF